MLTIIIIITLSLRIIVTTCAIFQVYRESANVPFNSLHQMLYRTVPCITSIRPRQCISYEFFWLVNENLFLKTYVVIFLSRKYWSFLEPITRLNVTSSFSICIRWNIISTESVKHERITSTPAKLQISHYSNIWLQRTGFAGHFYKITRFTEHFKFSKYRTLEGNAGSGRYLVTTG